MSDVYILTLAALLGLVMGSFFNVVILRLPQMMIRDWYQQAKTCLDTYNESEPFSVTDVPIGAETTQTAAASEHTANRKLGLVFPASHCPKCQTPIKPWHNIPIISYLWLQGRCAACQATIAPRYPIIEAVTALFTLFTLYWVGITPWGLALVAVTWTLIVLSVIDLDHHLLPDSLTLPLLWAGLGFHAWTGEIPLEDAVFGAMAGYLSLWSVYWSFKLLTGKEGMGYGDFKLLAALGAWLGWQMLPVMILLSSLVGALVGISLMLVLGRDRNVPIPFGPYLAIAGWIAALWGDELVQGYFALAVPGL